MGDLLNYLDVVGEGPAGVLGGVTAGPLTEGAAGMNRQITLGSYDPGLERVSAVMIWGTSMADPRANSWMRRAFFPV